MVVLLCGLWSENNFLSPTGLSNESAHLICYAGAIACIRLDSLEEIPLVVKKEPEFENEHITADIGLTKNVYLSTDNLCSSNMSHQCTKKW